VVTTHTDFAALTDAGVVFDAVNESMFARHAAGPPPSQFPLQGFRPAKSHEGVSASSFNEGIDSDQNRRVVPNQYW
jgi:hypothetical protein